MISRQVVRRARELLETNGIENASLTAEVLLRHVLQITRVRLFQELDRELTGEQEAGFFDLIRRHIDGEPVAYITGHKEFYDLDFMVDNRVLIPRPETELLIEKALAEAKTRNIRSVADIGTGSGCIAVTLAIHLNIPELYAVDNSPEAIDVARLNSRSHNVASRITFLAGDLLAPLPGPVDMIAANLPYVKTSELDEPSLHFEPRTALDGGADGLDQFRRFIPLLRDKVNKNGVVLLEIGLGQYQAVFALIRESYPDAAVAVYPDFNRIERVIIFYLSLAP